MGLQLTCGALERTEMGGRMTRLQCPVCEEAADGGHHLGDTQVFVCSKCGSYRLSGTAARLLELGTLSRPDPAAFAALVEKRRGNSAEYPIIREDDLKIL